MNTVYKFNYILLWAFILFASVVGTAQTEAPSWVDFAKKKKNHELKDATLSDYSYSGYHFSNKEIPDVSAWNTLNVTDFGANPNDGVYDDSGIRAAIDAAIKASLPTVVYFPAGKYLVADAANANSPFIINGSNIVLKGAGSGVGGTEIFTAEHGDYPWRFHFIADKSDVDNKLASIRKRVNRGDFTVEVDNVFNLKEGQEVELYHRGLENLAVNIPGLIPKEGWTIAKNGIRTLEKHTIKSIDGFKVTFTNPIQYTITADISGAELRAYHVIEEVGIEDILFTSGWTQRPEVYAHHESDFVDYAYRALAFDNVKNGWIRNCEIKGWNESIKIEKSLGVTVKDIIISGKQGHTSYFAKYSYGILFENCRDIVGVGFKNAGGQGHGPGMRWATVNTVFLNCTMMKHQSVDCHGYHPYCNLLDNVSGGSFYNNGGAESSYPQSGPHLTFWNFTHNSHFSSKEFNFWENVGRQNNTYAKPIFVGFKNLKGNVTFKNEGLDELREQDAYPKSLFDAQLQLRRFGAYLSASSAHEDFPASKANDSELASYWTSATAASGAWVMMDLGLAETVNKVSVKEYGNTIATWKLEAWQNNNWSTVLTGTALDLNDDLLFDAVTTRKLRFTVLTHGQGQESNPVSLKEFDILGLDGIGAIGDEPEATNHLVNIYPNPSRSSVTIAMAYPGEKAISIFSLDGSLVYHQNTNAQRVQVNKVGELKSGLYLVSINDGIHSYDVQRLVIN